MLLKRSFKRGGSVKPKALAVEEDKADECVASKLSCVCSDCGKAFVNSSSLNRHVREKHGDAADQVFVCDKCPKPKSFTNKRAFLEHQSAIHEGKGHQCNLCKAYFLSKDKLMNHEPSCQGPAKAKLLAKPTSAPVKRSRKSDAMSEMSSRQAQSEAPSEEVPDCDLDDFPMITDEELLALPPSCCDFLLLNEEDEASMAASASQTPEPHAEELLATIAKPLTTFVVEFARLVESRPPNLTRQCESFWNEMGGTTCLRAGNREVVRNVLTTITDLAWRDPRCQIVLWRLGADEFLAQTWCLWRYDLCAELEDAVNALVQRSLLASLRLVLVLLQRARATSSSSAMETVLPADIPGNAVRHLVQWVRSNALAQGVSEMRYLRNNIVQWVLTNTVTDGFSAYFEADQYFATVQSEQSTLIESLYVLLVDTCLRVDDFDNESSSRHHTDPKATLELLFRCATIAAAHAADCDERPMRFHVWYAEQVARLIPSTCQSTPPSSNHGPRDKQGDVVMSLASEMNCNSGVAQNSFFQLVPRLLARRTSVKSPLIRGLTGIDTEDLKGGAMLVQNLIDNTRYDQAQELADLLVDSSTNHGMADLEGHLAVLLMKGETGRMRRYMQKARLGKPIVDNFEECKGIYLKGLAQLASASQGTIRPVEGELLEAFYNLSLARLYMEEDQFAPVGEYLEQAIALRIKHLQSDHPLTVQAKYNFGVLAERRAAFLLDTLEGPATQHSQDKASLTLTQVEADLDKSMTVFGECERVWLAANKVAWVATLRESKAETLHIWGRLEMVHAARATKQEDGLSRRKRAVARVEEALRNLQMCIETRFRVFGGEHERYQRAVSYYHELKGQRDHLLPSTMVPSGLPLIRLA